MIWSRSAFFVGALAVSQSHTFPSSLLSRAKASSSPDDVRRRQSSSSTRLSAAASADDTSSPAQANPRNRSPRGTSLPPPPPSPPSLTRILAASPMSLESYHLLVTPNAWKKVLGTVVVISALPHGFNFQTLWKRLPFPAMVGNLVLPLAASSCCLLQMGLNVLSVGCAGWNSYLGPVRPYFLGVLLIASLRNVPSPSTLAWRSAVALLPEIIFVYNTWRQSKAAAAASKSPQSSDQHVIHLDIPTMGCVACINSIDSKLSKVPAVISVQSQLNPPGQKGGSAVVVVATRDDPTALSNQLIAAVADAGFANAAVTDVQRKM